jgi:predicted  nucleic acid-binding Zn-ribbon protein
MSALTIRVKDLETQIGIQQEQHAAALSAMTKERDEIAAWKAEHEPKISALAMQLDAATNEKATALAELETAKADLAAKVQEIEAAQAEIAKVKATLQDPAFVDAAAKGGEAVAAGKPDSEVSAQNLQKLSGVERVKAYRTLFKKPTA